MGVFQVLSPNFQLAKVVGESDEGMTLFVPKARVGTFLVDKGDRFLMLVFIRGNDDGEVSAYTPWEL